MSVPLALGALALALALVLVVRQQIERARRRRPWWRADVRAGPAVPDGRRRHS
jgi:hypothetical protein